MGKYSTNREMFTLYPICYFKTEGHIYKLSAARQKNVHSDNSARDVKQGFAEGVLSMKSA